jgi:cation transport protein ChaC
MPVGRQTMALTEELVARCKRFEPDPGPEPGFTHLSEAEYDILAAELLAQRSAGPLWLFAYGSLIWNPDFIAIEHRRATAHGWSSRVGAGRRANRA